MAKMNPDCREEGGKVRGPESTGELATQMRSMSRRRKTQNLKTGSRAHNRSEVQKPGREAFWRD